MSDKKMFSFCLETLNDIVFEHNDLELVKELYEIDEFEDGDNIGMGTGLDYDNLSSLYPNHEYILILSNEYNPDKLIGKRPPISDISAYLSYSPTIVVELLKQKYKIDLPSDFIPECIVKIHAEGDGVNDEYYYLKPCWTVAQSQGGELIDWINISDIILDEDKEGEQLSTSEGYIIIPKNKYLEKIKKHKGDILSMQDEIISN